MILYRSESYRVIGATQLLTTFTHLHLKAECMSRKYMASRGDVVGRCGEHRSGLFNDQQIANIIISLDNPITII